MTDQKSVKPPSRFAALAIPLLLIAVTAAVYWPILRHNFVGLDDEGTIYGNPNFVHISGDRFYEFWVKPYLKLYAPLTYTVLGLIAMGSRRVEVNPPAIVIPPWPFHAVSLVLHCLAVLAVYRILRSFSRRRWPAAAGALLFALHPVQVESVAWATEINNLLCISLSLASILLYLRSRGIGPAENDRAIGPIAVRRERSYFILGSKLFAFALLSKPIAIVVPWLAAVVAWGASPPDERGRLGLPKLSRGLVLWILMTVPIAIIARIAQPVPEAWVHAPIPLRPLVAADALAFYLYKLVFPITLTPDYSRSPDFVRAHHFIVWTWVTPLLVAIALILYCRKRPDRRPLAAAAIGFVIALVPVLGLTPFAFQHMSTVADRYLYLPMLTVALAVAWGLDRIDRGKSASPRKISLARCVTALSILILSVLAIKTFHQTRYWRDTLTLYQHSMDIIGRRPGVFEGRPW